MALFIAFDKQGRGVVTLDDAVQKLLYMEYGRVSAGTESKLPWFAKREAGNALTAEAKTLLGCL